MNKTLLFLIILIALGILIYDHFTLKKEIGKITTQQQINGDNGDNQVNKSNQVDKTNQVNKSNQVNRETNQVVDVIKPIEAIHAMQPISMQPMQLPTIGQVIKDYDYRTLEDPLTPPFKRDDYMIPSQMIRPDMFGLYTSGAPGTFRKMGYLKATNTNSEYKYLNLIGRPKYNGSSIYEYYITSTNRDNSIKFYLNKYKKELYDGDTVKVPQIGSEEFEVIIDKDLNLEYNPLLF